MQRNGLLVIAVALLICVPPIAFSKAAEAGYSKDTANLLASVDGQRILDTVSDLQAFGSRAFYLESSRDAAVYIHSRFQELGLNVQYQNFSIFGYTTGNVIATLQGTSADAPTFLFGAHYDSFNELSVNYSVGVNTSAPGADDDASGVAAIIELATILSPLKLKNSIMFVAFGAEELGPDQQGGGPFGSEVFVQDAKEQNISFAGTAILDMIGFRSDTQNRLTIIMRWDGNPFVEATAKAVEDYSIDLDLNTINNPYLTYSDHAPFWEANYPSLLAIEELDYSTFSPLNPFYHTSEDKAYTLSESQMSSVTKAFLGAVLSLDPQPSQSGGVSGWVYATVALVVVLAAAAGVMAYLKKRREAL